MSLFTKAEPVIVKESSSAYGQLAALEALRGTLPAKAENRLESDIRSLKAGIAGEERVLFELCNSHEEMYVLRDLFLEHDGLTAQIDFLVLTLQRNYVLECKSLYGDVEIDSEGNFFRVYGGRRKEGFYSPITQNRRHVELIHAMKRDKRNLAMNLLLDNDFDDIYRSLVVLANDKTVVRDRYAKRDVKKQIIRADQLVATIRSINDEKGAGREKAFRSKVRESAEWFLSQHKDNPVDYAAKYREIAEAEAASNGGAPPSSDKASSLPAGFSESPHQDANSGPGAQTPLCPRCGAPMVLRTAKRGANAGNQFYGCSNYPHCRGIVNVGH